MPITTQDDFPVLRIVAHIHRGIGIVLMMAGCALTIRTASTSWDIKESWIESVGTFAIGLAAFAFGELIVLFLQIEKNTRRE
jgi:hypothetical protein